jgi:hypothetical protein
VSAIGDDVLGVLVAAVEAKLLAAFWVPEMRLAAGVAVYPVPFPSTIQMSVPLTAIPST